MVRLEHAQKQLVDNKYEMSANEVKEFAMQNNRMLFGLKFWSTYTKHDA